MNDSSGDAKHQQWAGGYYCHNHHAGFEKQEATTNDDCCPWCGENVEALL